MSTDTQKLSIEVQAATIASFAQEAGLEIVRTYADEGRNGLRLAGRKALQQLLSDVEDLKRQGLSNEAVAGKLGLCRAYVGHAVQVIALGDEALMTALIDGALILKAIHCSGA